MATLTELQKLEIKEHMLHEEDALTKRFKSKKNQFDKIKVPHSEVESRELQGWIADASLRTKTPMTRKKEHNRQFEDDIWCMFYNLGFRILNADDKLRIQWGNNQGEDKQVDVVAVGDEAIFVVECKSAESKKKSNFQKDLAEICQYKDGMADSLRQVYGKDKRVKFIFATRNYRIEEGGDDDVRMKNNGIYHLDENGYNYITNLIKSYQNSVIYQFYGIMFKDELINGTPVTIPALRGEMGGQVYYLFSIEPSTLLKIGFVLHRTKVNDSMAPTYQRLLVPKRLKGITKFIDGGGFFPNSIILNFADPTENLKVTFEPIHKEDASNAEFGLLHIPNAYGIAYIIDGQHRVYGYSNSKYKDRHTIPVVAFQNMPSEEQLRIFMEINENQKAVSKNLKIDLEEDLLWKSNRLDSRMKALRSSIIKALCSQSSSVLYNKISIGEDQAELKSLNFSEGLSKSGLIPKAQQTKFVGNTDSCLYDIKESDHDKAMKEARTRIVQFINECYEIAEERMTPETKNDFLFSNRATFAFITISGLLNTYLYTKGEINAESTVKERIAALRPYLETLCDGLNGISDEESSYLRGIQGQAAQTKWLNFYMNLVNKSYPDYLPEELKIWKETRDQDLQKEGENLKEEIRDYLRKLVIIKLKEVYKSDFERKIAKLENDCKGKIIAMHSDDDNFNQDDYNWEDWIELNECREKIDENFSYDEFSETFGISFSDKAKSKKEKLAWISMLEKPKGKNKDAMTKSDVNKLWLIHDHLNKHMPTDE